ncbi:MAG: hypothetical protein AABY22_10690 [Nanoarchaeota archaeon]
MALPKRGVQMSNDERMAVLETTINHVNITLEDIKNSINRLNNKMEDGFNMLNNKIDIRCDKLNDRLWTLFFWMIGGFAAILGIMAHGFHWI